MKKESCFLDNLKTVLKGTENKNFILETLMVGLDDSHCGEVVLNYFYT